MSQKKLNSDDSDSEYRSETERGQITIPAPFRGDNEGWIVEQNDDGTLTLTPANKLEENTEVTVELIDLVEQSNN